MKKFISLITILSVIVSMFSFAGVSAAEEVLVDESFENGFGTVWNFKNSDYAKEHITIADGGSDGQKSALFVDDTDSTSAILYSIEFDTSEGDVFEMSADFKHVEGKGFSVYYKFKDSSNKEIYKKSFGSTATEWTKVSATATAPAGAVKFFLQITGGIATTGKTYIDNVKAVRTYNASEVEPEEPSENPEGTVVFEETFEGDMSQWTYSSEAGKEAIAITDSEAHTGEKALSVTDDSTTVSPPFIKSIMISGKPGDQFKISAYFKHESGKIQKIWTRFCDEDGNNELADSSFGSSEKEWTLTEYTAVIPEGKSNLRLLITGAKTSVGKTYIDDITVVKLPKEETEEPPVIPEETVVFEETFEGDMSQWTYSSEAGKETIAITDSEAHNGSKSLYITDESKDTYPPNIKSGLIPGEPGDQFKISAYFKLESGTSQKIWTKFYDADGTNEKADSSFGSSSTEWTLKEYTAVIPEGSANLRILITGAKNTVGKTYIDDIKIVKIPKAESETPPADTPEDPFVPEGDNVEFYDNFENGLSKWNFKDAYARSNMTITDKEAYTGKSALCGIDDSESASPTIKTPMISGEPGDGFKISAYIKNGAGSSMSLWTKFFDGTGKNQVNGTSFTNSKAGWGLVENIAFIPEGSKQIQIWITGGVASLGTTYIDDIVITRLTKEEIEELNPKPPVVLPAPEPIEGIPTEKEEDFHIYLCIGQSNMVGADPIQEPDMVVVDGAYLYNSKGNWELAQPYPTTGSEYMGYNRYSTVSASGRTGPTIGFARGMALKVPEGVKVGIISNAIGGTTVQEWSKGYGQYEDLPVMTNRPDRNLFEKAVERTKEALAKGGVLKGIFYLQGESCAAKAGYMDRLVKIANNLREDIGVDIEDVPFFLSEIPQVRAAGVAVIRTAPQYIENCYVISSEGLTIFDSIHFDADSQRKLGLRFAETALRVQYGINASADDMYNVIYGNNTDSPNETVEYKVVVNGQRLVTDTPAIESGGRIFVPVRAIFEALGATVEWNAEDQIVTGKRGDTTVVMQIGDEHMNVNGVSTAMLIAPMIKDMRTLVPIRFVGEGLGATVNWDEKTFTATIELK